MSPRSWFQRYAGTPAFFKARLWTFIPLLVLYFATLWAAQGTASLHTMIFGTQARGTVRAVARCHNSNGSPDGTVKLTVAFRDAHGMSRAFRETECHPYRIGIGHTVALRYLTADPRQVATQDDLDHLARQVLWVIGLWMVAACCVGVLVLTIALSLGDVAPRGLAGRVTGAIALVGTSLLALGGIGIAGCLLVALNIFAGAGGDLSDPSQTATVTGQVIRVTSCAYSSGSSDVIGGAFAHLIGNPAGSAYLRPADSNSGEDPTVRFVDRSGLTQEKEFNECDPLYRVGMSVTVTYVLTDPTQCRDDAFESSDPQVISPQTVGNCLYGVEFIIVLALLVQVPSWIQRARAASAARRNRTTTRRHH